VISREFQLVRRPHGEPVPEDFRLVSKEVGDPEPGQVLVATIAMSVDPYMRGRMNAGPSYAPAWELDEPMQGGAVGEVVAGNLPAGTLVTHGLGWRDYALLDASAVRVVQPLPGLAPSLYLGALGMTGLTAYAGLFDVAGFKAGDRVFVSGAAGAVGSMVGQFARLRGASAVIGSAGSDAKVAYLTEELGFTAGINYRDGAIRELLAAAAPSGIDVFFDNVGGDHLQAALDVFNPFGRAALCGAISGYNATGRSAGPDNMALIVGKRLSLRGFIVGDHSALAAEFRDAATGWLTSGQLVAQETVVDGLENAVTAFIGMLRGENTGKMVVRLSD
jgi:NADPH-dependent curcumin reductase CurA